MTSEQADARPGPGRARSILAAYAHPGAAVAWGLVALGLLLDLLSLPPGPLPWLAFAADAPFLLLLVGPCRDRWKRWTFLLAFLHYALGFHWLAQITFAQVVGASLVLTPIYLIAGLLIRRLHRRGVPWLLVVPTVLVFEEIVRTIWMGGMPLPSRALALSGCPSLCAATAYFGGYSLVFLAALGSAAIARLFVKYGAQSRLRVAAGAAVFAGVALALYAAGALRVADVEQRLFSTDQDVLVSVQGNVAQELKHSAEDDAPNEIYRRHLDLSRAAILTARTQGRSVIAILWPETMVPWPFTDAELAQRFPEEWENEVRVYQRLRSDVLEDGIPPRFLLGAIYQFRRGEERHLDVYEYGTCDSLFFVDPAKMPTWDAPYPEPPALGTAPPWVLGRYDKRLLVPGGEYTPLGEILPPLRWFRNLVSVIPELDRGADDQAPFVLVEPGEAGAPAAGIRAGTVICFELLGPGPARDWRRAGSDVLLGAANYGWFGRTAFRAQIRAVARIRAAETATTVVVAGNTGPTLFYDPLGRAYGEFGTPPPATPDPDPESDENTFREGWSMGPLILDPVPTPYVGWGDLPWYGLGLLVLLWGLVGPRKMWI